MIIVMAGLPGSGKSFHAKRLIAEHLEKNPQTQGVIVSADDYFLDSAGEYVFDAAKLNEAHLSCFKKFSERAAAFSENDLIVVDNTNTKNWERSPYLVQGAAMGHSVKIVRVTCDVGVCVQRNTHSVPKSTILRMAEFFEKPLPWWSYEEITN